MKLSKLINEDVKYFANKNDELAENPITDDEKRQFLETVQNFSSYGDKLKTQVDLVELAEELSNVVNMAERIILSEKDDWFDKITVKRNTSEMKKLVSEATKTAREAKSLHERLQSLYEDCSHILGRYFETKKPEPI